MKICFMIIIKCYLTSLGANIDMLINSTATYITDNELIIPIFKIKDKD